jgi:hypothetical protein
VSVASELPGRPCLAGDCGCDALDGEEVCAFHLSASDEITWQVVVPLTREGKWDGFGAGTFKPRKKDDRAIRKDELVRATTPAPDVNPSYAGRRSKFADIAEAAMRSPKGTALPLPPGEDEKKYLNGLRGHLKQNRQTMHGRWSVTCKDGTVYVRRIGSFDDVEAA